MRALGAGRDDQGPTTRTASFQPRGGAAVLAVALITILAGDPSTAEKRDALNVGGALWSRCCCSGIVGATVNSATTQSRRPS